MPPPPEHTARGRTPQHEAPLVSVVIPCYNHARFLGAAIESALGQTHVPVEMVVVDDGSTDATPCIAQEVAARDEHVRYVWQENRGLAAARNAGLRASSGRFLIFLDADDRLLPEAAEEGLRCFEARPACAFVYGAYRWIKEDGSFYDDGWAASRIYENHYAEMLRRNYIAMHATVMYRRGPLEAAGGFDSSLAACEDYDLYLRLTRAFPIHCHRQPVAEYRMHGENMSNNVALMLKTSLDALHSQRPHVRGDERLEAAYEAGIEFWRTCYGEDLIKQIRRMWQSGQRTDAARAAGVLLRYDPARFARYAAHRAGMGGARALKTFLPDRVQRRLRAVRRGPWYRPEVGRVRMGDLRRLAPIDRDFGYGRGQPVDRYYIERFLAHHAHDIRAHVLEIKSDAYTRRFGGEQVARSDVLDIDADNPQATIVADLAAADQVPSNAFDCVILTQTLHLIYDARAALATLHCTLKPGGVLLMTVPGITKVQQGWYWSFTEASARRLLEEAFPGARVAVQAHGNVLAAQAFLQGLAVEDLRLNELDHDDPEYPVVITARVVKPEAAS